MSRRRRTGETDDDLLEQADASLLELIDHVLNRGVMVTGDVVLGLAGVDLVYVRLSALLCAADRLLEPRRKR
jgi:Gas vesicle protein